MSKKINIFVNDKYICSSLKYKTCKEAKEAVYKAGFYLLADVVIMKIASSFGLALREIIQKMYWKIMRNKG